MFQHGATCYPNASTVNSLTGSAHVGSVVVIGGQSYVLAISGVTDTSITYDYAPASGGAHITQTIAMAPPPCALLTAADAVQVAWMIGAVWISIYCITFLISYFKSETMGISNDA